MAAPESRKIQLEPRLGQIETARDSRPFNAWKGLAIKRKTDEGLAGLGLSGQPEIRMNKALLSFQGRVSSGLVLNVQDHQPQAG